MGSRSPRHPVHTGRVSKEAFLVFIKLIGVYIPPAAQKMEQKRALLPIQHARPTKRARIQACSPDDALITCTFSNKDSPVKPATHIAHHADVPQPSVFEEYFDLDLDFDSDYSLDAGEADDELEVFVDSAMKWEVTSPRDAAAAAISNMDIDLAELIMCPVVPRDAFVAPAIVDTKKDEAQKAAPLVQNTTGSAQGPQAIKPITSKEACPATSPAVWQAVTAAAIVQPAFAPTGKSAAAT